MAKPRITLIGVDELREKLEGVDIRQVAGALNVEAERIMTTAKRRTPVDTGTLRASGHVQGPKIVGDRASVVLGFGGAASAYALVQHERTDYHHVTGQAKFLESAMNDASKGFEKRLIRNVALFE